MDEKLWVASYLYYDGSLDSFLKNAVSPFVKILKEKNAFKQFFFIRYFERGRHIRLRFKTDVRTANDVVKPLLIEYFNDYFKKNPSVRNEPELVKNLPDDKKWLLCNSIHFFEYEPEISRYGGPVGILISEEHFQICSQTVLNAIGESENWSYTKSMGTAIQLMVSFCYAVGMNIKEMTDFFSYYCNIYIASGIRSYFPQEKIENTENYRPKILAVYEEKYNSKKDFYVTFLGNLMKSLENKDEFEEKWFNEWIDKNRNISEKLNNALEKDELVIPELFIENHAKGKKKIYMLFYIYNSYMHMTYNRLGLENKDESFLCYIIKESLRNLNQ